MTETTRRAFLAGAAGLLGAAAIPPRLLAASSGRPSGAPSVSPQAEEAQFPADFSWGTATASYQIEGASKEDGRGESIWDRFSHTPGKVKGNATGDVACDSYHRYREDVALMKALNTRSYRFSIAWPRILPTGSGAINEKGLDYYKRLVDALLEAKIRPFPTLYHWDLPQALEDAGGWPTRATADRFTDYARIVVKALGDRVTDWMIFNEPNVFVTLGYGVGMHAPGKQDYMAMLRASHVVNLAQGMAFGAMRAERPKARIGGAWNLVVHEPADPASEADRDAARRWLLFWNSWYLDPALRGTYPEVFPMGVPAPLMGIENGDLEKTRAAFDFIGINHYNRLLISTAQPGIPGGLPGQPGFGNVGPKTDNGWEVWPKGFYDVVVWTSREYKLPIEITENGCAYNDGPDDKGRVPDQRRIEFYRAYLRELARARADGADVRGYHAWSLLDNFEWIEGYEQRFGLVHVDFASQKRTIKDSGHWYAKVAATGRV